jgi:hypothetical protein
MPTLSVHKINITARFPPIDFPMSKGFKFKFNISYFRSYFSTIFSHEYVLKVKFKLTLCLIKHRVIHLCVLSMCISTNF